MFFIPIIENTNYLISTGAEDDAEAEDDADYSSSVEMENYEGSVSS